MKKYITIICALLCSFCLMSCGDSLSKEEVARIHTVFPDYSDAELKYMLRQSAASANALADSLERTGTTRSEDEAGLDAFISAAKANLSVPFSDLPPRVRTYLEKEQNLARQCIAEVEQLQADARCGKVPTHEIEPLFTGITKKYDELISKLEAEYPDVAAKFSADILDKKVEELGKAYKDILEKRMKRFKKDHPNASIDAAFIQALRISSELFRELAEAL